jgi:hypothetical protein
MVHFRTTVPPSTTGLSTCAKDGSGAVTQPPEKSARATQAGIIAEGLIEDLPS